MIEVALVLLPKVTYGVAEFVAWVGSLRQIAKQAEVWTLDYETAWREGLLSQNILPEELPDSQ